MQNASDILGLLISILLLKFFHQPWFCCCAHHKIEVFNFNHRTCELCKKPQIFLPFFKCYADINMNLLPPYVFIGWANLWVANMADPEIIGICFIPCTSKCILWPAFRVFGNFKMCCISAFRFYWWLKNCKAGVFNAYFVAQENLKICYTPTLRYSIDELRTAKEMSL